MGRGLPVARRCQGPARAIPGPCQGHTRAMPMAWRWQAFGRPLAGLWEALGMAMPQPFARPWHTLGKAPACVAHDTLQIVAGTAAGRPHIDRMHVDAVRIPHMGLPQPVTSPQPPGKSWSRRSSCTRRVHGSGAAHVLAAAYVFGTAGAVAADHGIVSARVLAAPQPNGVAAASLGPISGGSH